MSPFFQKKMVLMEWGLVTKNIFFCLLILDLQTFLIPLCKTVLRLMRLVFVVSLEDLIHTTFTISGESIINAPSNPTNHLLRCLGGNPSIPHAMYPISDPASHQVRRSHVLHYGEKK